MEKDQIEKMAIDLEEEFVLCGTLSSCGTKRCSRCFSKYLYEQDYRKLSEDSVVLSKEEYEKLQKTISDLKCDKFDLKNEISEKDNKIALLEETIDCIKFNVGFARKETAREILREIRGYYPVDLEHCDKGEAFILELCYELANKYGVEIKE